MVFGVAKYEVTNHFMQVDSHYIAIVIITVGILARHDGPSKPTSRLDYPT